MYVQALEHMFLEACTRAEMDGGGGGGANWHKALAMLLLFLSHLERQVCTAYGGSECLAMLCARRGETDATPRRHGQVFSAYEGSEFLAEAGAGSRKFFRANRKVSLSPET